MLSYFSVVSDSDSTIVDVVAEALELSAEGIGNGMPGVTATGVQKCDNASRRASRNNPFSIPHQSNPLQNKDKGEHRTHMVPPSYWSSSTPYPRATNLIPDPVVLFARLFKDGGET